MKNKGDLMTITWTSVVSETPEPGERVLVCNDISEWVTPWKAGLTVDYVQHPVTHFARVDRPYAARPRQNGATYQDDRLAELKRASR